MKCILREDEQKASQHAPKASHKKTPPKRGLVAEKTCLLSGSTGQVDSLSWAWLVMQEMGIKAV